MLTIVDFPDDCELEAFAAGEGQVEVKITLLPFPEGDGFSREDIIDLSLARVLNVFVTIQVPHPLRAIVLLVELNAAILRP